MRLASWNVNGVRAAYRKGLAEWLMKADYDVLALQETKASPGQIPAAIADAKGYHTYFSAPERPGYSGVGLLTKTKPKSVDYSFGNPRFDQEGRVIAADYGAFTLFNVYFPNGGASEERLRYKLDFYDSFLEHMEALRSGGRSLIVCGDVNTAHTELDIARPKENERHSGFMPVERAWLDKLLSKGYVDTFRLFTKGGGHYTWWDMKTRARERDVGWRLDYFLATRDLAPKIRKAGILKDVQGSDHCPVTLELDA